MEICSSPSRTRTDVIEGFPKVKFCEFDVVFLEGDFLCLHEYMNFGGDMTNPLLLVTKLDTSSATVRRSQQVKPRRQRRKEERDSLKSAKMSAQK